MPDRDTIIRDAPNEAFKFTVPVQIEFAKQDDDDKGPGGFKMTLYDGGVIEHYYWGNLAFDLATMKLKKKNVGVLYRHDTLLRLGVTTEATFDGKFKVEGKFLTNEDAQKIRQDAAEGFPFEASLSYDRRATKEIVQVSDGAVVECNGKKVKGPGAVIRGSVIDEVSICVHGALTNTKVNTFDEQFKEQETMTEPKKEEMTVDKFSKDHPDAYQAAVTIGEKNVRKEFEKFVEHFSDDPAFIVEQFGKGVSMQDAILAENKKLKASKNEKPDDDGNKVDPAESEFSDNQTNVGKKKNDDEQPTKFMDIAREVADKKKIPLSKAISQCTETHEKEYQTYLDEQKTGKV